MCRTESPSWFRAGYGRLLALLAAPSGDICAAEDAIADALERALIHWPAEGVPDNPEGWVLTVARNRLRDHWKSHAHRMTDSLPEISSKTDEFNADAIPDRRLELMLVRAHPAIAVNCRTPLMLQTVLGVDATAIAQAFATPAATMAQRLVRAKRRIRDARTRSRCRAAPTSTSGYLRCWRRRTARMRLTGRPLARPSNRCPARRSTWRWCWPSCCPTNPRLLGWRRWCACRSRGARQAQRRRSVRAARPTRPGVVGSGADRPRRGAAAPRPRLQPAGSLSDTRRRSSRRRASLGRWTGLRCVSCTVRCFGPRRHWGPRLHWRWSMRRSTDRRADWRRWTP